MWCSARTIPECLFEDVSVLGEAVAGEHQRLGNRLGPHGCGINRFGDGVRRETHHPVAFTPKEPGIDLASHRIAHHAQQRTFGKLAGGRHAPGDRIQRPDAIEWNPETLREALRCGNADAHAGERARPTAYDDLADVVSSQPERSELLLERHEQ